MNGDTYYSCVKVDKYKFRVGDCAYFTPNSDDQVPYIGQITKLWQAKCRGKRNNRGNSLKWVQRMRSLSARKCLFSAFGITIRKTSILDERRSIIRASYFFPIFRM